MKCEMCHEADAATVIRKSVADEMQEFFVCQDCADKEAHRETPHVSPPIPSLGETNGGAGVPLMGMVLDAAFEIVGRSLNLKEPACPVCGILRDEYRKRSRLGCPACYEAFSKELDTAIVDLHRATQHTGKTPEKARAAWHRQQLASALEDAVKGQRYEEAIALRDQLSILNGSETAKGGSPQ